MNARTLVHRHTAERARRFPDVDPRPLACNGLSARDAGLARAIDHAVARRWLTLVAVIDSRLTDQRWPSLNPSVQAALLVGAAQLLLMEKIPDHAAIDQAVRWIKTTRRARASGLVNAVLRRVADLRRGIEPWSHKATAAIELPRDAIILSDGRLLRLVEPVFAQQSVTRLVEQTSHSEELIAHWMAAFDRPTATMLALHGLVIAPMIVTGLEKKVAGMIETSRQSHSPHNDPQSCGTGVSPVPPAVLQPHQQPGFAVFTGDRDELDHLLTQHPQLRVQDPTTARSVNLARRVEPAPTLVIDYCAGKGTKTRQLAELFPTSRLIATEKDASRFETLRSALGDVPNVEIVPFKRISDFFGQAELLVLDVPCSNTGVLARRVEAKYRFTSTSLASLVTVQRQILADAIPLMKDDAWMLYTTCSIEPSENQQQVEWMTKNLPLSLVEEAFTLPSGLPGESPAAYHDGGYAAVMRWQLG